MSQINNLPIEFGVGQDTGTQALVKLEDVEDSLLSKFSGLALPGTPTGWQWGLTTGAPGQLYIRNGNSSTWVLVLGDLTAAGGGLVQAVAGVFTTLAPTSGTAATGTTDLTRKSEVDARPKIASVSLGDISGAGTTVVNLLVSSVDITITRIGVVCDPQAASTGANHWDFNFRDLTSPATILDYNTNASGDPTTDVFLDFGIPSTGVADANDVIQLQLTGNGTPPAFNEVTVFMEYLIPT